MVLQAVLLLGILQGPRPLLTQTGVLAGQVRLPDGEPAAGVRVAAMESPTSASTSASMMAGLTQTDADGRYRLEDVPAGRYLVVVGELDKLEYYPTAVSVVAGVTLAGLDFSLSSSYDGAVAVTVHLTGSTQPIPGALVNVRSSAGHNRSGIANEEGTVTLGALPYGDYSVSTPILSIAEALTNAAPEPGTAPRELSLAITIDAKRPRWKVQLGILRPGAVHGKIRDASGSPVNGARVTAMLVAYRNGRKTLLTESSTLSDATGDYVLGTGIGERYIRVEPPASLASRGYAAAFSPGTGDPARATPVAISNGELRESVDVVLSPTYRVSGRVVNAAGNSTISTFILVSRQFDVSISLQNRLAGPGGMFELSGVPAGSWDLFPMQPQAPLGPDGVAALQRYHTGRGSIDVADRNVDGINISLASVTVAGRLSAAAASSVPAADWLRNVMIRLVPRESIPALVDIPDSQTPAPDGSFAFSNVPPSNFGIHVFGLPLGSYVADIRLAGATVFADNTIAVGTENLERVEVIVAFGAGKVEGSVRGLDARSLSGDARVVLAPDKPLRQNFLLYRTATIRADGGFTILPDPAPGDYKIFAIPRLPGGGAEMDAEFIAKHENAATAITVKANQTVHPELEWIGR